MKVNLKMGFFFILFLPLILLADSSPFERELMSKIDALLDKQKVEGVIIALIGKDSQGPFYRTISKGCLSKKSQIPLNQWSELKIGPITQLFTAGVLAYLIQEGQVKLSDPISKFFSKRVYAFPTYKGKEITLEDLATHTSGLPNLSCDLLSFGPGKGQQMFYFLKNFSLKHPPGLVYEPSDLNYALLSHILMRVSKRSLARLIGQLLIDPLHLHDTDFFLTEEQKKRLVIGYEKGAAIEHLKQAGSTLSSLVINGLYSTAENMLTWLSFHVGKKRTSLNTILPAMRRAYRTYPNFRLGLGWKICSFTPNADLFTIEGEASGLTSYMGIVPEEGIGVVIFARQHRGTARTLGEDLLALINQNRE